MGMFRELLDHLRRRPGQPEGERLARQLERTPGFRVLRELGTEGALVALGQQRPGERVAAIVDTETTGLDPTADRLVEIAIERIRFDAQPAAPPVTKTPLISARASVKPDYIVCMECGAKQKMLKRHLATAHGLTPEQYRSDYGLPATYPMRSPTYFALRRNLAKAIGLGRHRKKR